MSGYCNDCGNTLCVCEQTQINNFIATNAEHIARKFHETSERLAPATKHLRSAVAWDDVPEQSRALMVAVVTELLSDDVFIPGAGLQVHANERGR